MEEIIERYVNGQFGAWESHAERIGEIDGAVVFYVDYCRGEEMKSVFVSFCEETETVEAYHHVCSGSVKVSVV